MQEVFTPTLIFFLIAVIVTAALIVSLLLPALTKLFASANQKHGAIETDGIVLHIESTGYTINDEREVRLHMRVLSDCGKDFFRVVKAVLPNNINLAAGTMIRVSYPVAPR